MRRLSHNLDWGFAPVLTSDQLYPKDAAVLRRYYPTDWRDRLCGRCLDVRFECERILVREHSYLNAVRGNQAPICSPVRDYIGVAVQYAGLPLVQPVVSLASPLSLISNLSQMGWQKKSAQEDAVLLYLMHEEREKDILLYYATHEDEILAQWQFWSQKLALPKLMVGLDGFVDEPEDRLGKVLFRRAYDRVKKLGLYERRSTFSRVRDVGARKTARTVRGREIMARH